MKYSTPKLRPLEPSAELHALFADVRRNAVASSPMPGFRHSPARERIPVRFDWSSLLPPGHVVYLTSDPLNAPVRPMRLWVSPDLAARFVFTAIMVGNVEQLQQPELPCAIFARHPDGIVFEMRICEPAARIVLGARNVSDVPSTFEAIAFCDVYELAP